MALIRPNNRSLQNITTLPTAVSSDFLASDATVGKVLQIVHANIPSTSYSQHSSGSFANTSMTASITPTSSSSTILINVNFQTSTTTTNNSMAMYRITANGTALSATSSSGSGGVQFRGNVEDADRNLDMVSGMWEHSPGSTSQQTYLLQVHSVDGSNITFNTWGYTPGSWQNNSSMTLFEIAG